MNPTETVEEYYEALRRGEPLTPYFAEREDAVKFGISEYLAGYEAIAEGLREQTRTTEDWRVESENLQVSVRNSVAWFTDDVALSWTDLAETDSAETDSAEADSAETGSAEANSAGERKSFDTRWSGVLERRDSEDGEQEQEEPRWRFVQMHVSAPHDL